MNAVGRVAGGGHVGWPSGRLLPLVLLAIAMACYAQPAAAAGPPVHLREAAHDISGFDQACGAAIDSQGNVYVSSAGESPPVIRIFNSSHSEVESIENANAPCALAVNSKGELFASQQANGVVVRYKPTVLFPFTGPPSYGPPEPIDPSGDAQGISIDRADDRLYVAKGDRVTVYQASGAAEPASNEEQALRIIDSTGGTYTVSFRGATTPALAYNATCPVIEAALEALPTVGAGNLEVVAVPSGEVRNCTITFAGALFQKTVPQFKCDSSNLTGGFFNCFMATTTQGFSGHIEGGLTDASGVAAYTHKPSATDTDRYVFVADAASDEIRIFGGQALTSIEPRRVIGDVDHDRNPATAAQDFGFGPAGATIAVDPGNPGPEGTCASINDQACTAGHFLVYDDTNSLVNEFEASGEFLDQIADPELASLGDAEPTAAVVDRSGGPLDGMIYVSGGSGPGSKLIAFGPLTKPRRPMLSAPLSRVLENAAAVAADRHGNVYVAAGTRIRVFDPEGEEVGPSGGIVDPEAPLRDLAVDSECNVYVLEATNPDKVSYYDASACPPIAGTTFSRQPAVHSSEFPGGSAIFTSLAVNPGPSSGKDHLYVGAGSIVREYESAKNGSDLLRCFACTGGLPENPRAGLAVNGSNGHVFLGLNTIGIYVLNQEEEVLARIRGGGCPGGPLKGNPKLAVDQASGHVLVFVSGIGTFREYDSSGACVAELGSFEEHGPTHGRVAVNNSCALHEPPLTETTVPTCLEFDPSYRNAYLAYDPPDAGQPFDLTAFGALTYSDVPATKTGTVSAVSGEGATLHGTVNPSGFELLECKFEVILDTTYQSNGKTFSGASSIPCVESLGSIGTGVTPVPVHADVSGLIVGERYRFRLVAQNKFGKTAGDASVFGPPKVTPKSAYPVLYDEATLRAEVDPSGLATTYHFEYGSGAGEYEKETPTRQIASGDGAVLVDAALTGLSEGTTYHFRVVAENEAGRVPGDDLTFTTLSRGERKPCPNESFRVGLSSRLPDCRAYELVTPAETNGLTPYAADSGSGGALPNTWLADPRGLGAGQRVSYFADGTLSGFDGNGRFDGYRATRSEGAHPPAGWVSELFGPSFVQSPPGSLRLPKQEGVSSDQLYSFWKIEPEETVPGTLPEGFYLRGPSGFESSFLGKGSSGTEDPMAITHQVSDGGAHAIFSSDKHLEDAAAPAGTMAIYDRGFGQTTAKVISVKPAGSSFGAGQSAAFVAATEDGKTVIFTVSNALYRNREGEVAQVAAAPFTFAGVSEDGNRVFYAAGTAGDTAAPLYMCDLETGPCSGPGSHSPTEIAPNSIFVHVSSDGAKAFLTSEQALTGTEQNDMGDSASGGAHNLYMWDSATDTLRFIGKVDDADFGSPAPNETHLNNWTAAISSGTFIGRAKSPTRSTPNGEFFVFESHGQLTSYDNEGHGEIYRYETDALAGERLSCVSCDPSGAPPAANAVLQHGGIGSGADQTIIANVTDNGQEVVFQSEDQLIPEDANIVLDVYRWEATGDHCQRESGCIELISSGQGDTSSFLYGMSADGRDVFFRTQEKLVAIDVPGSPSIYDARVGGGIPNPEEKGSCVDEGCLPQATAPPALPAPASTAPGDGNVKAANRCPKGKRKVRRAGKVRCLKRGGKKRQRRAGHERRAGR